MRRGFFRLALLETAGFLRERRALFILLYLGIAAALTYSMFRLLDFADSFARAKAQWQYDTRVALTFPQAPPPGGIAELGEALSAWECVENNRFYLADSAAGEVEIPLARGGARALVIVSQSLNPAQFLYGEDYMGFREGGFITPEAAAQPGALCEITADLVDYSRHAAAVGAYLSIEGKPFAIQGVHNNASFDRLPDGDDGLLPQIVVAAAHLPDTALPLRFWEFIFPAPPAPEQLEQVSAWLARYAPEAQALWPQARSMAQDAFSFLQDYALLIIALLNLVALLMGWVRVNRRQWHALYLCGASRGRLCALVAAITALMCLAALPPALALYSLAEPLLALGNIAQRLTPGQGLCIFAAVTLVAAAVAAARAAPVIQRLSGGREA